MTAQQKKHTRHEKVTPPVRRRRGRPPMLANNLDAFLARCSAEERRLPLLPWLDQLSDKLVMQLSGTMYEFVMYGLRAPVKKKMLPLLRTILQCERPGYLETHANYLDEERQNCVLWDFNAAVCVRRGDLPPKEEDGSVTYAVAGIFTQ